MANVNTGFKGSLVSISSVEIRGKGASGAVVTYRCLFTDEEGLVHAQTTHQIEVGEDSPFTESLRGLLDACRKHAEDLHFASPSTPTVKQVLSRGIAEAVHGSTDSADEPGEQG